MDGITISIYKVNFVFNNYFLFLIINNNKIPLEFKNIENFIIIILILLFFLPWNFPFAKIFMGDSVIFSGILYLF